jgi:hypothetical protein
VVCALIENLENLLLVSYIFFKNHAWDQRHAKKHKGWVLILIGNVDVKYVVIIKYRCKMTLAIVATNNFKFVHYFLSYFY